MLPNIKSKLIRILFSGSAALICAVGIQSASAAALPLPVETFVSGGTTIHVEVAFASGTGQHPTVLLLYGENGEAGLFPWNFPSIAVWFASEGYNCFIVHYLDKGPYLATAAIVTEYLQVINDATTWAESQSGVDPAKLAIMGDSLGAGLGVSEASRDRRIKVLAAWSGAEATWYERAVHNTVTYLPPTILIHGANDPISPLANAYALQTLLQGFGIPEVLDVYPNEGHVFNPTDEQESLQQTLAFFQTYI
jgi:dipeptidyl aminopeptidase/acylaminoacyl peptidase